MSDEVTKIKDFQEDPKRLDEAVNLFRDLIFDENFEEFLTLPAYNLID
jgi:hypothetical protein